MLDPQGMGKIHELFKLFSSYGDDTREWLEMAPFKGYDPNHENHVNHLQRCIFTYIMYNIFLQELQSGHFKQKTSQETHFYSSDIWVLGHWSLARFVIYRNLSVPPLTPTLHWHEALIRPNFSGQWGFTISDHQAWIFSCGMLPFGLMTLRFPWLFVGWSSGSVPCWILHVPDSLRVHLLQEELEFGRLRFGVWFWEAVGSLGNFWRTTLW